MSDSPVSYDPRVVELDSMRPHITGLCICVGCSYRYVVVLPADAKRFDLECPRCREMKSVIVQGDG